MSHDLEKLVCINLDIKFSHHRKLEIGKIYLTHSTSDVDSIAVYSNESGKFIGFFKSENFETIEENRQRKLNSLL